MLNLVPDDELLGVFTAKGGLFHLPDHIHTLRDVEAEIGG